MTLLDARLRATKSKKCVTNSRSLARDGISVMASIGVGLLSFVFAVIIFSIGVKAMQFGLAHFPSPFDKMSFMMLFLLSITTMLYASLVIHRFVKRITGYPIDD